MIFDIFIYVGLILLLLYKTRVGASSSIQVKVNDLELPGNILMCNTSLGTRVGLLNTPTLEMGSGILLLKVRSIHTKGMHFPIDVIFLDEALRVLGSEVDLLPGIKRIQGPKGTNSVLELGSGTINYLGSNLQKYAKIVLTPALPRQEKTKENLP